LPPDLLEEKRRKYHTYSRMNYKNIFSITPGKCRIVYLKEIPVDGLKMCRD